MGDGHLVRVRRTVRWIRAAASAAVHRTRVPPCAGPPGDWICRAGEALARQDIAALCIDAWNFGERRSESELFQLLLWPGQVCGGRRCTTSDARPIPSSALRMSIETGPFAWSSSTSLSASRRIDQRARPVGGLLHANATRCASCAPSNVRRRSWRDGRARTAASTPSSTHRTRTRSTVVRLTSNAAAIMSSIQRGPAAPSSAFNRMRACVSERAAACLLPTRRSNSAHGA
jgi:hypothetical protein